MHRLLEPSPPTTVQLSLIIAYIVVFSLTFILIYTQLWMIWYYRHKRCSHQTFFLFMCLIWAGLRITLFSFFFRNWFQENTLLYWILYSLPMCLQFSMLCLLLHFFSQIILNARTNYESRKHRYPLHLFILTSILLFAVMNFVCIFVIRQYWLKFAPVPLYLIYARVILTDTMFLVYGILLSISIFKITKMASIPQRVLEAKGTTFRKAVVVAILINCLFLSRTVKNFISISYAVKGTPDFHWIDVIDQTKSVFKLPESLAYASFDVTVFVLEVLPILLVVIIFRVKRHSAGQVLTDNGRRVFYFEKPQPPGSDNPQNSDCEDNLMSDSNSDNFINNRSALNYSRSRDYGAIHVEEVVQAKTNSANQIASE